MRAKATGICMILCLAGCGPAQVEEAPLDNQAVTGAPVESLPDADMNASLGELGVDHTAPPPAGEGAPRFVGRWAAVERECTAAAWTFTAEELSTPTGAICRFGEVRAVPGGYDVAARCRAEGPEIEDRLELRFAESAGAMLLRSESIAEVGLIPCDS
ncbi:MAG: hypothetical protein ACXWUP_08590 [Allosphingosinicella sp.]